MSRLPPAGSEGEPEPSSSPLSSSPPSTAPSHMANWKAGRSSPGLSPPPSHHQNMGKRPLTAPPPAVPPLPTNRRVTLAEILEKPPLRRMFEVFLRRSFCQENLEFYLAVEEFKKLHAAHDPKDAKAVESVREKAFNIWSTFLGSASKEREINVNQQVKLELEQFVRDLEGTSSAPKVTMFDEAQSAISFLISTDSVPKFTLTSDYKTARALVRLKEESAALEANVEECSKQIQVLESELTAKQEQVQMLEEYLNASEEDAQRKEEERLKRQGKMAERNRKAQEKKEKKEKKDKEEKEEKNDQIVPEVLTDFAKSTINVLSGMTTRKEKESMAGDNYVLCVDVLQGKDLAHMDKTGHSQKPNAFVTVRYGKQKHTTKVVMNTNEPQWFENFSIPTKPEESSKVRIEVYHFNVMGKHTLLGMLSFPSARSFSKEVGPPINRWFKLQGQNFDEPAEGHVQLSLKYRHLYDRKTELQREVNKMKKFVAFLEGGGGADSEEATLERSNSDDELLARKAHSESSSSSMLSSDGTSHRKSGKNFVASGGKGSGGGAASGSGAGNKGRKVKPSSTTKKLVKTLKAKQAKLEKTLLTID
ncbi:GTPase-activating protein [Balamuthia mandrillaris]